MFEYILLTFIKTNNGIRKAILYILKALSFINSFVPKKEKQILLYDSMNNTLTDNTLAVLLYFKKHRINKEYKVLCCVPNSKEKNIYGIKNVGIVYGILKYLTSKYVFYSFGGMRIKPAENQVVVNLWHGTPLKKIGKLNERDKRLQNEENNDFTYILVSAEYFKEIYKTAFGCIGKQILITGNPRNDFLLKEGSVIERLDIIKEKYEKTILWMPTFRVSKDGRFKDSIINEKNALPLLNTEERLLKFEKFLEKNNLLIVLKVHNYSVVPQINCKNILIITNDMLNKQKIFLYEFIKDFDALLTDYSSVFFDYLLLDRPIGFIIDDFDEYNAMRGFTVKNPLDLMPGEHIKTIDDLEKFLIDLINDIDKFTVARKKINNLVNTCKINNTKQLLDKIKFIQE